MNFVDFLSFLFIKWKFYRESRKIIDQASNQKLEFPKTIYPQPVSVNKFGNEVIQKKPSPEEKPIINKLRSGHSKGGLRDRSRDFITWRNRDPSVKFPSNNKPILTNTRNNDMDKRGTYQPSPWDLRSKEMKAKPSQNSAKVVFPSSIRARSVRKYDEGNLNKMNISDQE